MNLVQKNVSRATITVLLLPPILAAQPRPVTLKIKLDQETFTPAARTELQPIADMVAQLVDKLIPGAPLDYPPLGILCFEAPVLWQSKEWHFSAAPVTLSGLKLLGEPERSTGGQLRIALSVVEGYNDAPQFVFQLSHELAHVKMGHRTDNYLDETFAVALSFKALKELGYQDYLVATERSFVALLPPIVRNELTLGMWSLLRSYWQAEASRQGNRQDDRAFQTLGALLLEHDGGQDWSKLYGLWRFNVCSAMIPAGGYQTCPPNLLHMNGLGRELMALGFTGENVNE